jgi:hypothetical protein
VSSVTGARFPAQMGLKIGNPEYKRGVTAYWLAAIKTSPLVAIRR